jgi:putative ABC transport system permease protein
MKLDLDTWSEILLTITRNKTRSLLTAFGVFWGIFMLIALIGGGKGLQQMMSQNFKGFATNSGFMWAQPTGKPYKGFTKGRQWNMEMSDMELVYRKVKGVELVTPNNSSWGITTIYKDKKGSFTVKGLYPEYAQIEEQNMVLGRFINDVDIVGHRKVCSIGKRVKEQLFEKGVDPCGKYIDIDGTYYCVVGVSGSEGNVSVNGQSSQSIVIPYTTYQEIYNKGTAVDLMCVLVKPGYKITDVQPEIEKVLKEKHLIAPDDKDAMQLFNADAMFSMMDNLFTGIRALIWLVGLGTLLAGIIGVSNIMMVTVRERTTEIGIRRAIGAQPKDILEQILAESMVLTLVAGMAGICFAVLVLQVLEVGVNSGDTFSGIQFQVSFGVALGVAFLLLSLGLLAGLAPAYRALSIKPIDAIADE